MIAGRDGTIVFRGGGSGRGGAGISVLVLWKGTAVTGSAKLTCGKKGTQGTGGKPGTNDGIDGVAQNVLQVN
ncbi:MAG: hypothetical protein U0263_23950 [Polyangiaceae bacterium]